MVDILDFLNFLEGHIRNDIPNKEQVNHVVLRRRFWKFAWLSNLSILREPDEGYSRNELCALNFIRFVLMSKCKENYVKCRGLHK